jgi:hypothetical protein
MYVVTNNDELKRIVQHGNEDEKEREGEEPFKASVRVLKLNTITISQASSAKDSVSCTEAW